MNSEELIKKAHPLIIASINKYAKGKDDFYDLYQEGVAYILETIASFDETRGITIFSYLKTMLRYFYLNYGRYKKETVSLNIKINEDTELMDLILDNDSFVFDKVVEKMQRSALRQALLELEAFEIELLYLLFVKNETLSAVAKKLGTSKSTVFNRKTELILKLRKKIS